MFALDRQPVAGNTASHGRLLHVEQAWLAIRAAEQLRAVVA